MKIEKIWKYYFYLISALLLLGIISKIGTINGGIGLLVELWGVIFSGLGWLAFYGFIFGKRFFVRWFWLIFFILEIIGVALSMGAPLFELLIDAYKANVSLLLSTSLLVIGICIFIAPLLIAHYRYVFSSNWTINNA